MRRLVFVTSGLVFVLVACGSGHRRMREATELVSGVRGVHATAAERKAAAARRAAPLLRRFVPPADARPVQHAPRGLRHKPVVYSVEVAGPHRYFRVHAPLAAVLAAVKAHPTGFGARTVGQSVSPPERMLLLAPRTAGIPSRFLTVNLLRWRGQTFLRVDADAVWIYPRSPRERVPANVREIAIRTPRLSRQVTDPAQVSQIVRWFDALPVAPPGIAELCPVEIANVRFSFLDRNGRKLATAIAPPGPAWICNEIRFSIHGRTQRPLIDRTMHGADSFAGRVQRLLGLQLVVRR